MASVDLASYLTCPAPSQASASGMGQTASYDRLRRHPRRRVRRRRSTGNGARAAPPLAGALEDDSGSPAMESEDADDTVAASDPPLVRPQCIIDRSTSINWMELELQRALLISVVNNGCWNRPLRPWRMRLPCVLASWQTH
ncbi:hypothetical protein PR202_ga31431 [Eleusine coracana subsp. coracana]|uniref:Uncharacterized protein n=1 Tax=Eleusine coracana subsp. coracana TaxID=191504 RepID=A0AAV5DRH1_ELECO|nr:hypothetical protein PR202_ga31431 [Eleusine coracana subsp. coracana]